ncbi:hypothetical protein [Roseiterribacter gracilis]|uniref:Uncharacterized protein n=1 Tax=Roseiterribacter gracilis TaxID=2812848 RepID=A0A8S8X6T3_9PROT|nr:hypothetical protein TMPK1_00410 [Rhodospirillales bacterium TMPK1]
MRARLARAALPIAVIATAIWFVIATTQADAPRAFVQAIVVGVALYVVLHETARPLDQSRRSVSWRRR